MNKEAAFLASAALFVFALFGFYRDANIYQPSENSENPIATKRTCKNSGFSCYCSDTNFCFSSASKKFCCDLLPAIKALSVPPMSPPEDDLIFATASSSNHFEELKSAIASTQKIFNGSRIIFYDIGLSEEEAKTIRKLCNVEYRKFPMEKYQKISPRVSNLNEYRWKPLIINELLLRLSRVLWMDTSTRWLEGTPKALRNIYRKAESNETSPIIMSEPTFHSIFATTMSDLYKFFPIKSGDAKRTMMMGACQIYLQRNPVTTEVMKWWVLCALEDNCMAPAGSKLGCSFGNDRWTSFGNCHRFDQSTLNIILALRFGFGNNTKYRVEPPLAKTQRSPDPKLKPLMC